MANSLIFLSGADRDRTDDLLNAIQALSQLSYSPVPIEYHPRPEISMYNEELPGRIAIRIGPWSAWGGHSGSGGQFSEISIDNLCMSSI